MMWRTVEYVDFEGKSFFLAWVKRNMNTDDVILKFSFTFGSKFITDRPIEFFLAPG